MDATPEAVRTVCRYHATGGSTSLLATTASAPFENLIAALDVAARVKHEGSGGAAILGVHLEGPYFAPARHGCHLPGEVRPPRAEEYLPLLDAHPGLVRWMTLAPEVPGALELLAALRQRGVVGAAGQVKWRRVELRSWSTKAIALHSLCPTKTATSSSWKTSSAGGWCSGGTPRPVPAGPTIEGQGFRDRAPQYDEPPAPPSSASPSTPPEENKRVPGRPGVPVPAALRHRALPRAGVRRGQRRGTRGNPPTTRGARRSSSIPRGSCAGLHTVTDTAAHPDEVLAHYQPAGRPFLRSDGRR